MNVRGCAAFKREEVRAVIIDETKFKRFLYPLIALVIGAFLALVIAQPFRGKDNAEELIVIREVKALLEAEIENILQAELATVTAKATYRVILMDTSFPPRALVQWTTDERPAADGCFLTWNNEQGDEVRVSGTIITERLPAAAQAQAAQPAQPAAAPDTSEEPAEGSNP